MSPYPGMHKGARVTVADKALTTQLHPPAETPLLRDVMPGEVVHEDLGMHNGSLVIRCADGVDRGMHHTRLTPCTPQTDARDNLYDKRKELLAAMDSFEGNLKAVELTNRRFSEYVLAVKMQHKAADDKEMA